MKKLLTLITFLSLFAGTQAGDEVQLSGVEKLFTTLIKNSGAETHNKFLMKQDKKAVWALYTIKDGVAVIKLVFIKSEFEKIKAELEKELMTRELIQELLEKDIEQIQYKVKPEVQELYIELGFTKDVSDESGARYIKYL